MPTSPYIIETSDGSTLDLAAYAPEAFVPTLVSDAGRLGFFVGEDGTACFVEAEQLPPCTLAALAAAANLPDARRVIACCGDANSVDFHDARKAIVPQFKAFLQAQGLTRYRFSYSEMTDPHDHNRANPYATGVQPASNDADDIRPQYPVFEWPGDDITASAISVVAQMCGSWAGKRETLNRALSLIDWAEAASSQSPEPQRGSS